MYSIDAELPIRRTPFHDESGLGFCLRVSVDNGANLHSLRRIIGLSDSVFITQVDAGKLSQLSQTPLDWLRSTLPPKPSSKIRTCYGHRWYSPPYHLRSSPQLCPLCVNRSGYVRDIWDIALSTICVEHNCPLIDRCTDCGAEIRWNIPALEVGHCGHVLKSGNRDLHVTPALHHFQVELTDRLRHKKPQGYLINNFDQSRVISMDGWCSLITSIGICERASRSVKRLLSDNSTKQWFEIVNRALIRIEQLNHSNWSRLPEDVVPFSEAILMRMLIKNDSAADQRLAAYLLNEMCELPIVGRVGGRFEHLSQLELF